jgi:PncC family amidohydrolase
MEGLLATAERLAIALKASRQTLAIAESSVGGLLSAAFVAQPGASAFFLGGVVVYTRAVRDGLLRLPVDAPRASTEAYALLLARTMRERLGADWALAESGATGPAGNRYGDDAGHCCLAVTGPVERVVTIETGENDRTANMRRFAAEGLALLRDCIADIA